MGMAVSCSGVIAKPAGTGWNRLPQRSPHRGFPAAPSHQHLATDTQLTNYFLLVIANCQWVIGSWELPGLSVTISSLAIDTKLLNLIQ